MSDFNADNNEISLESRRAFAFKVFQLTSKYDLEISKLELDIQKNFMKYMEMV